MDIKITNKPFQVIPLNNVELNFKKYAHKETFQISNKIRINHLNNEEQQNIINLGKRYSGNFYNKKSDLSFTHAIKHQIRLKKDCPIYTKSYIDPQALKEKVQKQII